jgi:hypothetical protein
MKKLLFNSMLFILISNCATQKADIILTTPLSVTVKTARNYFSPGIGVDQEVYDLAQKYCKNVSGGNAVPTKSWLVPFDGNYFEFECKKI